MGRTNREARMCCGSGPALASRDARGHARRRFKRDSRAAPQFAHRHSRETHNEKPRGAGGGHDCDRCPRGGAGLLGRRARVRSCFGGFRARTSDAGDGAGRRPSCSGSAEPCPKYPRCSGRDPLDRACQVAHDPRSRTGNVGAACDRRARDLVAPSHGGRPRRSIRGSYPARGGSSLRVAREDGSRRSFARRCRRRTDVGHPGGRQRRARARSRDVGTRAARLERLHGGGTGARVWRRRAPRTAKGVDPRTRARRRRGTAPQRRTTAARHEGRRHGDAGDGRCP